MRKYILDEHGQISPEDPIWEDLDKWHDEDEYDKILKAVLAVPKKKWSNRLWFRLISALNNKRQFTEARAEIEALRKRCVTRADKAKLQYMLGYTYYASDQKYSAIEEYKKGMEADPEDEGELHLQGEIDKCRADIDIWLGRLKEYALSAASAMKKMENETAEKEKRAEEDFTMGLGLLSAIRKLPVLGKSIGLDDLYKKYSKKEKPVVKKFLKTYFGVTNTKTLNESAQKAVGHMCRDLAAFLKGRPNFDPALIEGEGRVFWEAGLEYMRAVEDLLPEGGIYAWDLSEYLGLARHAYGCDLLDQAEYEALVTEVTETARRLYHSWSDYFMGLLLGAGFYMFSTGGMNLKDGAVFLRDMTPMVLQSGYLLTEWPEGGSL